MKGMDMLIRFRFLEPFPRQIARFLHIRRGLARSAIGEFLGEMKHDLCVATARYVMYKLLCLWRAYTQSHVSTCVHYLTEAELVVWFGGR